MWTKKKESDILSQMASDARVCDADKSKVEPVLQPGARLMGCSVQTVRNVTKDLREPKMVRMWSEVDKSKAREMWFDGCSFSQIGRALDRNPSSVRERLWDHF